MKYTLFIFALLIAFSCEKSSKLPNCIDDAIDLVSTNDPIDRVLTQVVEGQTAYWLNTGAQEYDGVEYIVSNNCDTLCYLCGYCFSNICDSLYRNNNWELIWERE